MTCACHPERPPGPGRTGSRGIILSTKLYGSAELVLSGVEVLTMTCEDQHVEGLTTTRYPSLIEGLTMMTPTADHLSSRQVSDGSASLRLCASECAPHLRERAARVLSRYAKAHS